MYLATHSISLWVTKSCLQVASLEHQLTPWTSVKSSGAKTLIHSTLTIG